MKPKKKSPIIYQREETDLGNGLKLVTTITDDDSRELMESVWKSRTPQDLFKKDKPK